ncbi:MAG: hypothetical protein SXV54_18070 [Chloroflexota bacterium]|nr:hypothetical protein [Chloroflexota bacterium]
MNLEGTLLGKSNCAPRLVGEVGEKVRGAILARGTSRARLKHPHIVTIYDVGEKSDRYYFVIEYLEVTPYANTTSFRPRPAPAS